MIQSEFVTDFEAVNVPTPIEIVNNSQDRAFEARDRYFHRIIASLQLSHLALDECIMEDTMGLEGGVWLKKVQPLALAVRMPGQQNVIQFLKYSLNKDAVTEINEVLDIDRIISGF